MRSLAAQLSRLKNLLRRRGVTRENAEDLVQEAVLRLHVYTLTGREVRNTEAFLRRAALNLAIDAHRSASRSCLVTAPVEELLLLDMQPTPDEVLAAEQCLIAMGDSLDKVSLRTREVFFMHRLQGFGHAEIAEKLQISRSSVEKHIASAITTLTLERQRDEKVTRGNFGK
jgi:RNA polymerase sigma-70 factor (ECF subfamily)